MKENQAEIQPTVDLHFGRRDYSNTSNYVEFSFMCCFYELINVENSYWQTELSGTEIFEVFSLLNIDVDKELVKRKYLDPQNHDVEVFHSYVDEQVFAYFDLRKDPSDQNDMFFLGISCTKEQDDLIWMKLRDIYRKLQTKSPFTYDRLNLYQKVFHSYCYFYENKYLTSERHLVHHKK